MNNNAGTSALENVREEITMLGHMAFAAECLLSNFFDPDLSNEIKTDHIETCKVKLGELRAAIVSFGPINLNEAETKE